MGALRDRYSKGRGQGGGILTAGFALWTLDAGAYEVGESDDITGAVTGYLLKYQRGLKHWRHTGQRPPSSGSDFTATYVALRGLSSFGTDEQRDAITERNKTVHDWLTKNLPADTEDHVFRLRSLRLIGTQEEVKEAATAIIDLQGEDGGWSQNTELKSGAYATGSVVASLIETEAVSYEHPAIRRGISFLINDQKEDGSWHVTTRAKPFQEYYESGFPHDLDQFISIAASSWATIALARSLPSDEEE